MPSNDAVAYFDTQSVRPWNKPQLDNAGPVKIPNNNAHYAAGLIEFDMALDHNIRLKTSTTDYTKDDFTAHMDSWSDSTFYSGKSALLQINEGDRDFQTGSIADNGAWQKSVKFQRRYAAAPVVVVWLTGFDFEKKKNFRITATAESVTAEGFTLKIGTWSDTQLYWAQATWISYPSNHPTVASGSYSTEDVRPWNQPRLETAGRVDYPSGKFVDKVQLVFGINGFDVDASKGTSIRLVAKSKNESASGFDWELNSWFDTTLYVLKASYIALQI